MKRVILALTLLLVLGSSAQAANVELASKYSADVKVYVTNIKSEADLLVYVTKIKGQANGKDEIWYFGNPETVKVFYVDIKSQADLKVYFVTSPGQAGWKKQSEWMGRLR